MEKTISGNKTIIQVLKFLSIGMLNTAVDFIVLNSLILAFGIGSNGSVYTLFKGISFIVAVLNSYFFNKYWVFSENKNESNVKEGFLFFVVSFIGFLINISISTGVFILVTKYGNLGHQWGANVGALTGSILVLAWNFIGYKLLVFKK